MKSSFPKLQTAVDDVLARSSAGQLNEQEHQKVIASAKSFVAGISVSSEATIVARKDEAVKKLIAGANAFALSATSIRTELGQLGVTPLAVLPVAMWEDIVKKSGLYMFAGAHGNTFQVSDAIEEVPRRVEKAVGDFQKIFSGASAIVTLGATLYLLFGSYQLRIEIFFYLAGFLILFLLSKSLTKKVLSPAIVQWKVKQSVKKSGGANQFLWPNKKTPDASLVSPLLQKVFLTESFYTALLPQNLTHPDPEKNNALLRAEMLARTTVSVQFPQAPQYVQEILLKIAQIGKGDKLSLVVDEGAIYLQEDLVGRMIARVAELRQEKVTRKAETVRMRTLKADPIAVYRDGNVVAILAQYGDFPIEQQVVTEAIEQFSFSTN